MEPPEFGKRVTLGCGTVAGLVVSYSYTHLFVLWDDGVLSDLSYEDFDALVAVGSLVVELGIPDLTFPPKE